MFVCSLQGETVRSQALSGWPSAVLFLTWFLGASVWAPSAFCHCKERNSNWKPKHSGCSRGHAHGFFLFLFLWPHLCAQEEADGRGWDHLGPEGCPRKMAPWLLNVQWGLWARTFELLSNFLLRREHPSVSWSPRLLFVVGCFPVTVVVVHRLPECSKLLCRIQWLSSRWVLLLPHPPVAPPGQQPHGASPPRPHCIPIRRKIVRKQAWENTLSDLQCVFPGMVLWGKLRQVSRLLCQRIQTVISRNRRWKSIVTPWSPRMELGLQKP